MEKISNVSLKALEKSKYMKPLTMLFKQNDNERSWDLLDVHDSVSIIIHNISRNVLVFVKQFRPPVYLGSIPKEDKQGEIDVEKYPANLGITLELCAGIVDKDLPLTHIASEEVLEECGYKVDPEKLEFVSSYRSGVGISGSIQTLYYTTVEDDMKVSAGGGIDDEIIDVIEMTIPEVQKLVEQVHILSPPSFLFAMYWFLAKKL